jgi:hypothetical protein
VNVSCFSLAFFCERRVRNRIHLDNSVSSKVSRKIVKHNVLGHFK